MQPEEHSADEWFAFEQAINLPFAHPLYAELSERFSDEIRCGKKLENDKADV